MGESGKQDADIIDCDGKGCLVRQSWVDSYFALETKFKETIPADQLIKGDAEDTSVGNLPKARVIYRIPYPVVNHDADMRRRQKLAAVGP